MQFQKNFSLKKYNTFGLSATAKCFATFSSAEVLKECLDEGKSVVRKMILGGGSNILFTRNFDGVVLKNGILGMTIIEEDDEYVYIKAGAGVKWHSFVMFCVDHNFSGVENLSLIPGNMGASPMQNIGAYGVEIKDVFCNLEAFHLEEKTQQKFSASDCEFGYRESVFKNKYKNQFAILNVTYRLKKHPEFKITYGSKHSLL